MVVVVQVVVDHSVKVVLQMRTQNVHKGRE